MFRDRLTRNRLSIAFIAVFLVTVFGTDSARAADVSLEVDSRNVYVDAPFSLRIAIRWERAEPSEPTLPPIPGLEVIGSPTKSTSSVTRIINGQTSHDVTWTYSYVARATRPGEIEIPAITVEVDGRKLRTPPITLTSRESKTSEPLMVEVRSDRDVYYLGEPIDVTIEIWIEPFADAVQRIRLGQQQMWNTIDARGSTFGRFADLPGEIKVRVATRPDKAGDIAQYYVYWKSGTFTPREPGTIRFDDIRIRMDYPTRIRRVDRLLGRSWEVVATRPIVATVTESTIEVRPLPEEGRPPFFSGAVGRFDIAAQASPTEVRVGEPITLTLTIRDLRGGGRGLEDLRAPPLHEIASLTDSFGVPDEPLAGTIDGPRKTFTQSIRPTRDDIDEIPSIPFAYFDPSSERYEIVDTDPISITVEPSATLAMSEVIGGERELTNAGPTELTEVSGGILANYAGTDRLLAQQRRRPAWWLAAAVAVPPLAFSMLAIVESRRRRLRGDREYARRRRAARTATRRLHAVDGPPRRVAESVGFAVREYIADRCALASGAATTLEVLAALRERRVPQEQVDGVAHLLADCDQVTYAGGSDESTADLAGRAASCIRRLEREPMR
jgi:hypothetical protein